MKVYYETSIYYTLSTFNTFLPHPMAVLCASRYPTDLDSPIWLDDLGCTSSSPPNLRLCRHGGTGVHNCGHHEDVILSCLVGECMWLQQSVFFVIATPRHICLVGSLGHLL